MRRTVVGILVTLLATACASFVDPAPGEPATSTTTTTRPVSTLAPSTTSTTTPSSSTTATPTTAVEPSQLDLDTALIMELYDGWSRAVDAGQEVIEAYFAEHLYPELPACAPGEKRLGALTPDGDSVRPVDDWAITWGPLDGTVPDGRIYEVQLAEFEWPSHVTIMDDVAYVFWNCKGTKPSSTSTAGPTDLSTWVGVEFSVAAPNQHGPGMDILANVEHFPVQFLVDGEPVEVYGWYVGGVWNSFDGPNWTVVVVSDEPNPYSPTEWEQFEDGTEPVAPDPSVSHRLTVWAIEAMGPAQYRITDAMDMDMSAPLLGYGALMTVTQDNWTCDVDPALATYVDDDPAGIHREQVLYAFFDSTDYEELEIEARYPAVLAFTFTGGRLDMVAPESVRCVVRFDPDDY